MWITLLYLAFVTLLGVSFGAIFAWWAGGAFASVALLLAFPLERALRLSLRIGRLPIAALIPLVWLGLIIGTGVQEAQQAQVTARKRKITPLRSPVEASAFVDRTTLRVEKDMLHYTVVIRHAKSIQLRLPKITEHPTFHGPLLMPADHPPKVTQDTSPEGIVTRRWVLTLMAVATGPLDTPKFTIRYQDKGKPHTVTIPSIAVEVSELEKPNKLLAALRPAKLPALPERPDTKIPWPLVGGAGGGVLVLFLLGAWLRQRSLRPEPPMPPHEWFAQVFRSLQEQKLLEDGQEKAYYFALSELFRGFLERRFDFPALESTTEEIIQWAKTHDELTQESYKDIRRLLQWMDQIKFAGAIGTAEEREDIDRRLHSVVRQTLPQPEANATKQAPQRNEA
ncbi:MAG: hypothetical protein H6728_09105 [Myxococcales bacterium]|nr:hypothetical protein [Myxococcales bacterium]MCB9643221.1 hypothetical protein [Myxococcales bacterium]